MTNPGSKLTIRLLDGNDDDDGDGDNNINSISTMSFSPI
jgi:hypothetical protein